MMILNSIDYPTKAAVERYIKTLLKIYKPWQRLAEPDEQAVIDLINYHPHASEKIGCGINRIEVRPTPPYNSIGLWIIRVDQTVTDFSYRICLNGLPTPRSQFSAAARSAVQPSITIFRDNLFRSPVICPITGKSLSIDECHIDHAPPNYFSKIVADFILETGIDLSTVDYLERGDGIATVHFSSDDLTESFRQFHDARATLRAVDAEWNIKAGNRSMV